MFSFDMNLHVSRWRLTVFFAVKLSACREGPFSPASNILFVVGRQALLLPSRLTLIGGRTAGGLQTCFVAFRYAGNLEAL